MLKKLQVGIIAPAVALACLSLPRTAAQTGAQTAAQTAAQTKDHDTGTAGSTTNAAKASTSKHAFLRQAAEGGLAEVQLGELAQQKAESPEVKQFAERMVTDHTKANDQLKQVATKEGITVPEKLSAKDEATKARLEKLSGAQFDRAYMAAMVKDHTTDVTEFRAQAKTAKDSAVKNFASETLPTLEDHLKEAKSVHRQVAGTAAAHKPHTPTGS